MNTKNVLKFGFIKDEVDVYLNKMALDNNIIHLSEVHIDIYPENPLVSSSCYMLLLRATEKNASILVDNDRIILKRNDTYGTHFLNILTPKITECFSKIYEGGIEFILNIQNVYYRINLIN